MTDAAVREPPDKPPHRPDLHAALDAAFTAELTLRYHNYVEGIPAIGEGPAHDHFMQRWTAMWQAYDAILALIDSGATP